MPPPPALHDLIARFHDNLPLFKSRRYDETEARVQFINPLFATLGWDMDDRLGRGEVKHEDRVAIAGKTKAPDYGFRLDGRLRSFVEAKKPAVDVERQADSAFQLRRYAWTAKLPVSILTDNLYGVDIAPQAVDVTKLLLLLKVLEGAAEQHRIVAKVDQLFALTDEAAVRLPATEEAKGEAIGAENNEVLG